MTRISDGRGEDIVLQRGAAKGLYDYWNALRRTRRAPLRGEVDPAALRSFLPTVVILERMAPGHAVFRLAGTAICAALGRELRDHNFHSLWLATQRGALMGLIDRALYEAEPALIQFQASALDRRGYSGELLLLPLADRNGRLTRLLGTAGLEEPLASLGSRKLVRFEARRLLHIDPARDRVRLEAGRAAGRIVPRLVLVDPGPGPLLGPRLDQPWSRTFRAPLNADDEAG